MGQVQRVWSCNGCHVDRCSSTGVQMAVRLGTLQNIGTGEKQESTRPRKGLLRKMTTGSNLSIAPAPPSTGPFNDLVCLISTGSSPVRRPILPRGMIGRRVRAMGSPLDI